MEKKEINYKGYRVLVSENKYIDDEMIMILDSIEDYAFKKQRALKVVFFNYDEEGQEAGVSFFYRREYARQ